MRFARLAWVPVLAAGGILLAGCTTPAPAPTPEPTVASIPLQESCNELSDVDTVLWNLSLTHDQGRLNDQEWTGALQLAARMLDRIDFEPDSPFESKLRNLQVLTEPVVADTFPIIDPESPDWIDAMEAAHEVCGDDLFTWGWVGG